MFATRVGDVLTTEFKITNNPESVRADRLIEDRLRGPDQANEFVIVQDGATTVDDPRFRSFVEELTGELRGLDAVASAASYYDTGDDGMVSDGRDKTFIAVALNGDAAEASDNVVPVLDAVHAANGRDGFEVLTAGDGSIAHTFNEESAKGLEKGEIFGIPIALIILVFVFGALVAAGVPILLALASIVVATGVTAIVGQLYELNFFVVNMITMVGLAVGIDYSLFIIHRFREERAHGLSKEDAIARTGATASRAVLFSGGAVIVGLLGMVVVPNNVYRSLAVGAVSVAAFAVLAALTLLPAILSLLGDRVNAGHIPFLQRRRAAAPTGGFWVRATSLVMAHPVISLVLSAGLLAGLAVPYFTMNPGNSGVSSLPESSDARQAFEILDADFSGSLVAPVEVAVDAPDVNAPEVQDGIDRLIAAIGADAKFSETSVEVNDEGTLAVVSAIMHGDPEANAAHDAVNRVRDDYIPEAFDGVDARVLVTGQTASTEDMFQLIARYTPIVFGTVLALSFVLLLFVFRSIVVPAKALVMNLLSVGAAYGLLVLVFQHGVGNEILGFQKTESIEVWLPLFLFAFIFGLSMDYHVFLLSRIRERFDQTGDNAASVAFGLSSTAALITGAASIMVVVFSAFALGELVALQQMGFGLAAAIFLDATVVRTILVPSSMQLLGKWNWYLPGWLRWLPEVRIEGAQGRPRAEPAGGGGD